MIIQHKYVLGQIEKYKHQFAELDQKKTEWKLCLNSLLSFYDNVLEQAQTDERGQVVEARERIKSALNEFDTLINADNLSMITHHLRQAAELY